MFLKATLVTDTKVFFSKLAEFLHPKKQVFFS